ncbi:hypothetical protein P4O66_001646 [Electrophorus voltai]|uniref:Ig-like domain-containing protein n=1 Tax=Electrophorus voltai TaxID=2609070 RepID=A0AAD8Z7T2_9TELE|nr:hypothetical protein P4O66_001646 [Electrophorus voltai]
MITHPRGSLPPGLWVDPSSVAGKSAEGKGFELPLSPLDIPMLHPTALSLVGVVPLSPRQTIFTSHSRAYAHTCFCQKTSSMISIVFTLSFSLQCVTVLAGENGVTQSRSVLWALKGNSAEINCSHNKGLSYYGMYWYRQHQGKAMEVIVYTSTISAPDFGSFDERKFSAIKEVAENGSFTVKNLDSDDSALYFCASDFEYTWLLCEQAGWSGGSSRGTLTSCALCERAPILLNQLWSRVKMDRFMSSYNTILWYYQKQGGQSIHLIGYTFHESPNLENPKEKRFKMAGDGKKSVSLEISELSVNDSAVYFCAASFVICKDVHQTPPDVLCLPEMSVNLTCSHKISNYNTILWYRRAHGDTILKPIGYVRLTSNKQIEKEYEGHFNVAGDGESAASLEILQVRQEEDSAVYFCSAYYSQCLINTPGRAKSLIK